MIATKPVLDTPNAFKPRPSRMVISALFIFTILLFLVHHLQRRLAPSAYLNRCGRVVLISSARHGSTWFLNCAEGCATNEQSHFSHSNSVTELWVDHGSAGTTRDLTPESAVEYVRNNMSLKVMPITARREADLKTFFGLLDPSIPVFMLKRNPEDAYASLKQAKATGVWMRNKARMKDRGEKNRSMIVKDKTYFSYEAKLERFFEKVGNFMREKGVVWDEIDYDKVSRSRIIVGENQGCYVTNCNYV